MVTRIFALTALLAAFLVAGCGGNDQLSKEEYIKELKSVGTALSQSFNSLGESASDTKDTKALGSKFTDAAESLHKASDQVSDLNPPENAKTANEKLAQGLDAMANEFEAVGEAASKAGSGASAALLTKIQKISSSEGIAKVSQAVTELQKQGYSISQQ